MSTISHRGQLLPLKEQLIPISRNTVFYASYDHDLTAFNQGEKIYPRGYETSIEFNQNNSGIPLNLKALYEGFTLEFTAKVKDQGDPFPRIVYFSDIGADHELVRVSMAYRFRWNDGSQIYMTDSENNYFVPDKWHVYSVVFNMSEVIFYRDGVQYGPSQPLEITNKTPQEITIHSLFNDYTLSRSVRGNINDIRIWNRALPEEEIQKNLHQILRGNEEGLIGYWKLNEGDGIVANSSSMSKHDGIIRGGAWSDGSTRAILEDGKFKKCVLVEEGTENLIPNGHFSNGEGVPTEFDSVPINEIIEMPNPGDSEWVLRQTGAPDRAETEYEIHSTKLLIPSAHYSMSCWVAYTPDWDGEDEIFHTRTWTLDEGSTLIAQGKGELISQKYINGLLWEHRSISFKLPLTSDGSLNWYLGYPTRNSKGYRYITNIQLEEKPYATSFVNGVRDEARLEYNNPIEEANEFSISFWVKQKNTSSTLIKPILTISGDTRANGVFIEAREGLRAYISTASEQDYIIEDEESKITLEEWTHIVFMKTESKLLLYVNGNYFKEVDGPPGQFYPDGILRIGRDGTNKTQVSNFLIDDLRIDKGILLEEEIMAIYHGGPHYNYLDYTGIV